MIFFEVYLPLQRCGKKMKDIFINIILIPTVAAILAALATESVCHGQAKERISLQEWLKRTDNISETNTDANESENILHYIIEKGDTIYIDDLPAAHVYQKLPRQKGREWRKYYRLVHNFSKVYPYALVARHMVAEADSTIAADNLKRGKRDKYINNVQKELFAVFETPLRNLTVSQGALLMKLIDREVGKSSFNIIKYYKNGMAAGFWQGIAKLFGSDLKKPYDPDGEDSATEELVEKWESGEFEGLYYSLFWKYPPQTDIPSKYK